MFRKPKKAKTGRRRKEEDDEVDKQTKADTTNEDDDEETSALLNEARKRIKLEASGKSGTTNGGETDIVTTTKPDAAVMHQYATSATDLQKRNADLITSTVQLHPEAIMRQTAEGKNEGPAAARGEDGIFRDKTRSKLLAGPIKATGHIRTTCRFDYQPDICKDYKETGFCGFGDTCIYLHDRGDTLSGWQLEKQWEEEQKKKKEQQDREIQGFVDANTTGTTTINNTDEETALDDDGLPFACYICRNPFTDPVVTSCGHFFCENCIMDWVKTKSDACPICSKDTHRVFNQATKLKRRRQRNKNSNNKNTNKKSGGEIEIQHFLEAEGK